MVGRWLRRLGLGTVALATFVSSLLLAAVIHLDLPAARQATKTAAVEWFNGFFLGTVKLERIDRLGALGLTLRGLSLADPDGRTVLSIGELDVDLDLFGVGLRLLQGYKKLSVVIDDVTIGDPRVHLYQVTRRSPSGEEVHSLSLVDAFALRHPSPESAPGKPIRVWFPKVRVLRLEGVAEPLPERQLRVQVPAAASSLLITDKGVALDIDQFGLRAVTSKGVRALALGSLKVRAPGTISGQIQGSLADVPFHQAFAVTGDTIAVDGAFLDVTPEKIRPLVPSWPIDGTLRVENHLKGTLPRLQAELLIQAGDGEVRAQGLLTVAPGLEADLDLDAERLNLAQLRNDLPDSALNLRSSLEFWFTDARPNLELNATLLSSTRDAQVLPIIDLRANYDERGLVAKATLHERGLPLHVDVEGQLPDDLDFALTLRQTDLQRAPRLHQLTQMTGYLQGVVRGHLGKDQLHGQLDLRGSGLSVPGVTTDQTQLTGQVTLPLDRPPATVADLHLGVTQLRVGDLELSELAVQTRGAVLTPQIELTAKSPKRAELRLAAHANLLDRSLDRVHGELEGLSHPVKLTIDHLHAQPSEVVVRRLHIQGEGSAELDLSLGPNGGHMQGSLQDLNLERIMTAAGFDEVSLRGRLDGEADLRLGEDPSGKLRLGLRQGAFEELEGVDIELRGQLDGRNIQGELVASIEERLRVESSWNVLVPHSVLDVSGYRGVTGDFSASLSEVDLAWLAGWLPAGPATSLSLQGRGLAEITLTRDAPGTVPAVSVHARTAGLSVAWAPEAASQEADAQTAPLQLTGVDVDLRGAVEPESSRVDLALRLEDLRGDLVTTTASLTLPLPTWLERPPSADAFEGALRAAPFEAVALLSERNLGSLPEFVQPPGLSGVVGARLVAEGSLIDPHINLALDGQDVEGPLLGLAEPIAVQANLVVHPRLGRVRGTIEGDRGKERIGAVSLDAVVPQLAGEAPAPGAPLWRGAVQAFFEGAPLELVSGLARQDVKGRLQGSISVSRLDGPATLAADLRLRRLQVGEQRLGVGAISATTRESELTLRAQFDDEYGSLDIGGRLAVRPTPELFEIDFAEPLKVTLDAKNYDAAVLAPLTGGNLQELQGSLLGGLALEVSPPTEGTDHWKTTFGGHITLSDGTITPSAMGLRMEDVHLALVASREGEFNVVRLEGFRARARSNVVNLRGSGVAYFRNLSLDRATFRLEPLKFPALSAGNKVADLSGSVTGTFRLEEGKNVIDVKLGQLSVELPSEQDRGLIDIEKNETIEVLEQPAETTEADPSPGPVVPTVLNIDLERGVRLKNRMLSLAIRGTPQVVLGPTTEVTGDIELVKGGRVQVLGKIFVIEYGRIMFNPNDSLNPHLDLEASWRASSGVIVRANISGTVNEPTIEWNSEPPLPGGESAIIALVVGSGGQDQEGIPIALLAAPLNQALGETGMRGVEFYAGTESNTSEGQVARLSDRTWNSYTASVQISDEVWFEGSYRQERSGPAFGGYAGVSGTVDWRFAPNWSARTEAGMLGFGADLQWQYRY